MHQKSEVNNQLIEGVNEAVSSFYHNFKQRQRNNKLQVFNRSAKFCRKKRHAYETCQRCQQMRTTIQLKPKLKQQKKLDRQGNFCQLKQLGDQGGTRLTSYPIMELLSYANCECRNFVKHILLLSNQIKSTKYSEFFINGPKKQPLT